MATWFTRPGMGRDYTRGTMNAHFLPPCVPLNRVDDTLASQGYALMDARSVCDWLALGPQDLAALHGVEKGSLRLAILTTVKYTVPKLLGGFCAAHPGIDVAMVVGNRENLLQRLAANQDDLYIMGQPPEHMDVLCEPFADNPLVLVAPPEHPLAGQANIPPQRLAQEFFVVRESGSGTRLTSERYFASHGIEPPTRLEVSSHEAIKQTVAGGLGLAVVSASTVVAELALGELVQLDVQGFPLVRHWYVVTPRGKRLSAAAQAFKAWLFDHRPPAAPPARPVQGRRRPRPAASGV